ncbi:DUF5719 family protein [Leucobacter denitrificans]|uniref:DUF5719 family protein n=1 Tax=Leucobacter denitrificans TaxID=683042 RepID=UPI003614C658
MTERTKLVTGGARALTGVLITAAAAAGALLIGTLNFPTVESEPRATQVDTMQTGARELVCAGAFAELGADPSRPDVALPVGRTNVSVSGDGERKELGSSDTDSTSVGGAAVFTGTMSEPLAAAQIQQLDTATLSGTVAGECVEPVNEQWLLGGASMLGYSTTLSLGNPGSVAATVHISVFDENGKIDDQQTSGVIVAPQSQQIISLNGYAPDSERFAVRVTSTGAPVGASLSVSQIDGINPVGAATVTRQVRAETVSVVPGVANEAVGNHGDGDADSFPVRVQAIAPGEAAGTAEVFALSAEGERISLGGIELQPGTLSELEVVTWPKSANAVVVESEVPVFTAVGGSANNDTAHDFDWFIPAPELSADTELRAAIVPGGKLILTNSGSEPATVTISSDDDSAPRTVEVQAGSAVPTDAKGSVTIESTAPVSAGVRVLSGGAIAGYPVIPSSEPDGELTIYTR